MKTYQKLIALLLVSAFGIFALSCGNEQARNGNAVNAETTNANAAIPPDQIIEVEPSYAQTPTDAYKSLYEAVKAKDTEKIKSFMTQQTLAFAQAQAGMKKEPVESMYKNGFTATTFAESLPKIRDQRIKDDMGALEVYNEKEDKWKICLLCLKMQVGNWLSAKFSAANINHPEKDNSRKN